MHANGQQLLNSMNKVKNTRDSQVAAHQEKQRAQAMGQVNSDMNDLRPTDAQGFPKENPADFMAAFKF